MDHHRQNGSPQTTQRLLVLPCGYDNQVGNVRVSREFLCEVAADSPDSGVKVLELASRVLDQDSPAAREMARTFENRLAVEILIHAAAQDFSEGGSASVNWWPVTDDMTAGDELLLLLSPAPIPYGHVEALVRQDGFASRSLGLDAIVGTAKRYGSRIPPRCFDHVRLSPFRFLTGGGLIGRGRLIASPALNEDGELEAPIGEVRLFPTTVNPTLLDLPSAWSEDWDVGGESISDMEAVQEADLTAALHESLRYEANVYPPKKVDDREPPPKDRPPEAQIPGGWQIEAAVARGGQGTCYRASKGSKTAIVKLVEGSLPGQARAGSAAPNEIVELGRQLPHSSITWYREVLGESPNGEGTWVLMDDRGESLAVLSNQMGLSEKLAVLVQVGKALLFLHANGIAWNDVKPENILIDRDGCAFLCDPDLVSDGRRTGTPFHLPSPTNPDCELDLYAFVSTAIRVLLENQVPPGHGGIRLGDLYPDADPLAKLAIIDSTGLGDFSVSPNAHAAPQDHTTETPQHTSPDTLNTALEVLEAAHQLATERERTRALEETLAEQLPR